MSSSIKEVYNMGLIYFTQGLEIAFLVIMLVIVTKLHLDERKEIQEEIDRIELEENSDNLLYLEDYREEA